MSVCVSECECVCVSECECVCVCVSEWGGGGPPILLHRRDKRNLNQNVLFRESRQAKQFNIDANQYKF